MSIADGASRGSDDPVLASALAEMDSDGALTEPSDLPTPDASQPESAVSADPAPDSTAGDTGPVPTDPPAVVVPDPLEGTQPFTYSVNGVEKTLDGVYRVPGEGLLVPEDKVAALQSLAERADTLDRVTRDYAATNATFDRLSEWRTTGADGKETVLRGPDGIAAQRVAYGQLHAAFSTLTSVFTDPAKFAALVDVDPATNAIIPNQQFLSHLLTESDLAEMKAEQTVRQQLQALASPPAQPAAPDYAQHAPQAITQAAGPDAKHLSAEDRALLTEALPRYVRAVTEDDRRTNPALRLGGPIIDASYTKVVQHMAKVSAAKVAASVAGEKAGKHNAGMEKGRQPAPAKPAAAKPLTPARPQTPQKADWESPLAVAMSEIGITR